MCKSLAFVHVVGVTTLTFGLCYIYLNETNNLDKVKRKCKNKLMDLKDDVKKKVKG